MPEDVAPRPDDLANALRALAARRAAAGVPIELRVPASVRSPLEPAVSAACVRICEEALDNAILHAHARQIAVELIGREDRIVVRILDDGDGFEMEALHGEGMGRMNELARSANGRLDVRSAPGAGTCISVMFRLAG
jgi:signal transduction histidine kinase